MTCRSFLLFLFVIVTVVVVCCLYVPFNFFPLLLSLSCIDFSRGSVYLSISQCISYIHVIFFCTLVLGSRNVFFLYPSKAQCHFFVYLKVGGGQLESLRYFDHHTHFITCTVIILSCNHVL